MSKTILNSNLCKTELLQENLHKNENIVILKKLYLIQGAEDNTNCNLSKSGQVADKIFLSTVCPHLSLMFQDIREKLGHRAIHKILSANR